ncbi:MAG: helix-turn-helix domain-containing protein [Vicinamibacterales bacterium]
MKTVDEVVGAVRAIREQEGWSYRQLARLTGVTPQTLGVVLTSMRPHPQARTLAALKAFLLIYERSQKSSRVGAA